jgi:predicted dehydrogenase
VNYTRRKILAAPALVGPAVISAFGQEDEVRVAVVGVGNRGTLLLRNVIKIPGVRVVAVCDILAERAAAAAKVVEDAGGGSARQWQDFRKMLDEQKDIDAVVLATPDWTHKDLDIAILEVGKHLYAEKPLATTPEDCKMVVNAARQARGVFQVGFQLRHDPNRNAAAEIYP